MIAGIGVDMASIERIRDSLARYGDRFRERCFTEGERAYCERRRHPENHYASRFAAKEACSKALGTGISRGIYWKEIEVLRDPGGPPRLVLHGRALNMARERGIAGFHLSLSHDEGMAIAFVVLETE